MRAKLPDILCFTCSLAFAGLAPFAGQALAETPTQTPVDTADTAALTLRGDQRVRMIVVEDSSNRVDEIRYGGQTQSITVQPKSGAPEYEVLSNDGVHTRPTTRDGNVGPLGVRVWNVIKF